MLDLERMIADARAALDSGKADDATSILDQVLIHDPRHVAAHILRARALSLSERADEAVDDLSAVLIIETENEEALFLRGQWFADRFQYADASHDLELLLQRNPGHHDGIRILAEIAVNRGSDEAAIELYSMALAANPTCGHCLRERGECHLAIGNKDEGVRDLLQAVAVDSKDMDAAFALAGFYCWESEYFEALPLLKAVVASGRYDFESQHLLVASLVETGHFADAAVALERLAALSSDGTSVDKGICRRLEGVILLETGKLHAALEHFTQEESQSDDIEFRQFALRGRAEVHLLMGNPKQALKDAFEAIRIASYVDTDSLTTAARACVANHRPQDAMAFCDDLLGKQLSRLVRIKVLRCRAEAWRQLGNVDNSEQDEAAAREIESTCGR